MELVQVHSDAPLGAEAIREALWALTRDGGLHRRAAIDLVLSGPWRPSERWDRAPEQLAWSASFTLPRGAWLDDATEAAAAASRGFTARGAPFTPAEVVAQALGHGWVVVFSDAARLAYSALYRDRRLHGSLLLHDEVALVRSDGFAATRTAPPPRVIPEVDRLGVLERGLERWLRADLFLDREAVFLLPETLGELAHGPAERVVGEGPTQDLLRLAPRAKPA
jgi:hypothetical protein